RCLERVPDGIFQKGMALFIKADRESQAVKAKRRKLSVATSAVDSPDTGSSKAVVPLNPSPWLHTNDPEETFSKPMKRVHFTSSPPAWGPSSSSSHSRSRAHWSKARRGACLPPLDADSDVPEYPTVLYHDSRIALVAPKGGLLLYPEMIDRASTSSTTSPPLAPHPPSFRDLGLGRPVVGTFQILWCLRQ
ncbi:hypothetical protein FRC11_012979, partial [Ceratobasidium sp. 423]